VEESIVLTGKGGRYTCTLQRHLLLARKRIDSTMDTLSDDAMETCFSFLGNKNYRFTAGTCHRFRRVHQFYSNRLGKHQTTSWQHAVESVSCAKLCWQDHQEQMLTREELTQVINKLLSTAIAVGSPTDVLEWARQHGGQCNDDWQVFCVAASRGHVHVLKWAHSRGLEWSSPAISYQAAHHGHVDILEFAYRYGNNGRHFLDAGPFFACGTRRALTSISVVQETLTITQVQLACLV
jgi:hypothetical protein